MNKSIPSSRNKPHSPFGRKKILGIVQEIEDGVMSRKEACIKYGMAYATLTEWMNQYGSPLYQANKRLPFPAEKKRSIIRQVLDGRMTNKEACLAYNLKPKVLNHWLLKNKREDQQLACTNHSPMPIDTSLPASVAEELQQAKLKIAALETMIDIAEQEFKISIRKKSGAKQ